MIVRDGLALTIPVLFSSGHPDAGISWRLFGSDGTELASGAVSVPNDALSANVTINAIYNTLPVGTLFSSRYLTWSYTVDTAVVNGETQYDVEARAPFGASNAGVRTKLGGVEPKDLPDSDISLIRSYISFRTVATEDGIAAATDGGANDLAMRDAIEALAALSFIPTIGVRIAASEDSGTNAFKRQAIDWDAVATNLAGVVNAGILVALPGYDPMANAEPLFILASPTADAITGA